MTSRRSRASSSVLVAPSILSADPLRFGSELKSVEVAGADWHHVDVMDGHFVPNLTFGLPLVRALKSEMSLPLDVHIMVTNPDAVALDYVKAGADFLSFPIESAIHSHRLLEAIRGAGAKAGVAINPGTSLTALESILRWVDLVNVMSVNPGFGGQSFIPETLDRVRVVASMLRDLGRRSECLIEVDGGVNDKNAAPLIESGADVLVAGTYVYKEKDRRVPIARLKAGAAKSKK